MSDKHVSRPEPEPEPSTFDVSNWEPMQSSSSDEEKEEVLTFTYRNPNYNESSPSEEEKEDALTFTYKHPNTMNEVSLKVSDTLEVKCPGCKLMVKQLVRHLKQCSKDNAIPIIDLEALDKQLKLFRNKNLKRK